MADHPGAATPQNPVDLENIPATRRLVEQLTAYNKIDAATRARALDLLYPHDKWRLWIGRILLYLGGALVLAGVIFFFAFNWWKITPLIKFASIEAGIVVCLLAAFHYSLQGLIGQMALLAASVLVGVFLAVFGQIYQTGADAYELFMMWSLLTLGWTLLSRSAPQWIFWLIISNAFVMLWWGQAALPERDSEIFITIILAALNGTALLLREIGFHRGMTWLSGTWSRVVLILTLLLFLAIPVLYGILDWKNLSYWGWVCAIVGLAGHFPVFYYFRIRCPDMLALASVILSFCAITVFSSYRFFISNLFGTLYALALLVQGILILGIFAYAVFYLRRFADHMERHHD